MSSPLLALFGRFSSLLGARMAGAVCMFAVNLLIARAFGLEVLGVFALYLAGTGLLAICLAAGFNSVVVFFASEYVARDRPDLIRGFVTAAARHIGAGTALAVLVLAVGLPAFNGRLPAYAADLSVQVLLSAIALAGILLNTGLMVAMRQQFRGMAPEAIVRPGIMITGVVLLMLFWRDAGLAAVLWLATGAMWVAFAVSIFWARKFLGQVWSASSQSEPSRWRRAAYPWVPVSLLWDYLIDLMVLVAGLFANAEEVAVLHICFRFRVLAGFGMRAIYSLLIPEIAALNTRGEDAQLRLRLNQANWAALGYAIAVVLFLAAAGPLLLGVFGADGPGSHWILLIICLTLPVRAAFGPAPAVLALNDHYLVSAAVMIAGCFAGLMLAVSFYPVLGIASYAAGYTLANLAVSAGLWRAVDHRTGVNCSVFQRPVFL